MKHSIDNLYTKIMQSGGTDEAPFAPETKEFLKDLFKLTQNGPNFSDLSVIENQQEKVSFLNNIKSLIPKPSPSNSKRKVKTD